MISSVESEIVKLTGAESRMVVTGGCREEAYEEDGQRIQSLSYESQISLGDVLRSIESSANNIVLHT